MTNVKNGNLKVMGEGSYPGGEYERIKITGQGEIFEGVCSKETKIVGQCHIRGKAELDQVHVTGGLKIDEELISNRIKVIGELKVEKSLKANTLDMRGILYGAENVELEKMDFKGGVRVNGLLNVGDLQLHLQDTPSKVGEIGGEKILIKSRNLLKRSYTLEAEIIEGDTIYLEYTTAKVVRGNNIEIGPHCHIEKIEYRSSLTNKEKNSKNIIQINRI